MTACGRTQLAATGPIRLDRAPQEVVFVEPVRASGARPVLCLEFHPPGDSREAARIHVALLTTTGSREPWLNPSVDRRGESTVCLAAGTDENPPRPDAGAPGRPAYRAVELSSEVPLSVRQIRWGAGG
jgi:hypothetical protein